jgi:hypothetical protein
MLTVFYASMKQHNHAVWETLTVCGCQTVLIGFNMILLSLSVGNWKKRASGGSGGNKGKVSASSPVGSPGAVIIEEKGGKQAVPSGSTVHVRATRSSQRVK